MATPLQAPPQALPSVAQAARAPCGAPLTATHCPTLPGTSQAWHWPPQALLQHTPSAQLPFTHWLFPPQATPSAFFGTHAPALHQSPATQSPSTVQLVLHAVGPQTYGLQTVVPEAGHVPVPLHEAGLMAVPAEQVPPRQLVDDPG